VKTHAVASDGDFWIAKVISTISQLEEDKKHVTLLENVEEEEQVLRVKAKETVESLRKVRFRKYFSPALRINIFMADFR
jgi:DNA polymerase phi